MTTNKLYGMNDGIINLVKNELQKDTAVNARFIYSEAKKYFPNEDFNITDIDDLIYHLPKD